MIKCPNKNLPEWKELEKVVPNMAYVIWNDNNGYGIDKAPNGEPSILFNDLLAKYNDKEIAIKEKAKIYTEEYKQSHIDSPKDVNGEPILSNEISTIEIDNIEYKENKELELFSKFYDKLLKGINSRLKSISRYKTKNQKTLDELKQLVENLSKVEAQQGVMDFVQHVDDTLVLSIRFLEGNIKDINSKQLVQLKRDYLGFYTPMIKDLQAILDTTNVFDNLPNKEDFYNDVTVLIAAIGRVNNKYDSLLKLKTREFLREYAIASGSPYVDEMIQWLEDPKTDIGWIALFVGMASNTNNEVIRIMENIIRNAKNQVSRNTLSKGKDLVKTLDQAKQKYGADVMSLLQEKDSNDKTTGYFVRPVNYGAFYKARDEFYNKLGEKYNLYKNEYGQWVPPTDEDQLKKYDKEISNWISKYANRRFTLEYYDLRATLSPELQLELDEIQRAMNNITEKVTIDGIVYSHLLTDKLVIELERLSKEKLNLANPYNLDGTPKDSELKKIADELAAYRKKLQDKVKYKTDTAKFNRINDLMKKKLSNDEYDRWYKLNTKKEYTELFWEDLSNISKSNLPLLERYEELVEKRRNILKLYRKHNSLEINMQLLSDNDLAMIKLLDQDIADLYTLPEGKVSIGTDELTFKDVATIVKTAQYKKDEANAKAAGPLVYQEWWERSHYEDKRGVLHPISAYTYLAPVSDKYIETVPNNYWSQVDETSEWVNPDFDLNGEYLQPKKEYFDNSKLWNEIQSKPEVKLLYEELLETMKESNNKIGFLALTNNYKLPLMTARTFLMISRLDDVFKGLKYAVKDALSIKDDDVDYVEDFALRPDNTPIKHIPTRFIKMLDDPSMITADVVGSVISYFSMADNYNEMSKVSDDLEMILLRLSLLEIPGKKGKIPGSMNVFLKAQLLLDINLYGKRKNKAEISIGNKKVDVTKALSNLYGYIGKVNLGFNMWAIGTNYVTGQGYTDMEAILGRYYDISDVTFAKKELFRELPSITSNLGNVNDDNKLLSMMLYNLVTRSNEETFNRLDNSAALRALNQHFWYNGYTAGDFVIKSLVLLSVYHSYRLARDKNGNIKFMTKLQFINENYSNDPKRGAIEFKQNAITLYDVYTKVDNKWVVDDKYKKYVDTKLENQVKNKINTLASKIDGNLSDTDRSAIHANTFALFLVMHRNFMIVGMQDRFKARQYNYNTGMVEEGMYRTVGKFILNEWSLGKLFALKQLLADYHNLEDFEKYNINKVMLEITNATMLSLAVSFLLIPLADGTDDDDKDWLLQAVTYIAMRSAFEFRTLYNPFELTALLNSPSAAFSSVDNAANMLKLLWVPNYFLDKTPFTTIDRGVYKGFPKALRNFIKVTPLKNIIEAADPKPKRKYLENQLML